MQTTPKPIHLALQGGGAHGAFTWGVLDVLLADGRLMPEGISGASAGALNAVALAHGWAQALDAGRDPAEGARAALARLWSKVVALSAANACAAAITRLLLGALPGSIGRHLSPYQANPLDINPLRELIQAEIDFERLARLERLRVFVSATDVETGCPKVFSGRHLTAQAVMASCCLPQLFQAPEIDGRLYWDGGYSANPALRPLVLMEASRDILLVQINPVRHPGRPASATEIAARAGDLTFNASLIAQMRTIALVNALIERGLSREGVTAVRAHRIDGGDALAKLPARSKLSPQPDTQEWLFGLGRHSARDWLTEHLDAVGSHSSIDLAHDYGPPLNLGQEPEEKLAA
jgi:NTE family protein